MGLISDILPDIAAPIIQGITQGGPRRQYKWNKRAAQDANAMNRENQQWLLEQNKALQAEQRQYDSSESQMKRYIAAGLNPHLIYGSGSSAGMAFPIDAGSVPGVNIQAPSASYPDVAGSFLRASQMTAQTELINAREAESTMNTALKQVQVDIAKSNPMLNPQVASWVSTSMMESAKEKALRSRWMTHSVRGETPNVGLKVNAEIEALTQRLGLNTVDLAIKNKILESKDFQNEILEVQKKWMTDSEMTPQHFYQGLMLILGKMMGR